MIISLKYFWSAVSVFMLSGCISPIFADHKIHIYSLEKCITKHGTYSSFPTRLKIYPDNRFEIIIGGNVDYLGSVEVKGDSLNFNANYFQMPAVFFDSLKYRLKIYNGWFIDSALEYIQFKKIE